MPGHKYSDTWRRQLYLTLDIEAADADTKIDELRRQRGLEVEAREAEVPKRKPKKLREPKAPTEPTWHKRTTPRGVEYERLMRPPRVRVTVDAHSIGRSVYKSAKEVQIVETLAYRLASRQWAIDRASVHLRDERDLDALEELLAFWNEDRMSLSAATLKMYNVVADLRCGFADKRKVRRCLSHPLVDKVWNATGLPRDPEERVRIVDTCRQSVSPDNELKEAA